MLALFTGLAGKAYQHPMLEPYASRGHCDWQLGFRVTAHKPTRTEKNPPVIRRAARPTSARVACESLPTNRTTITVDTMHRAVCYLAAALWLGATLTGLTLVARHANTPGPPGQAPSAWPIASEIQRASGQPTFVLFAHPLCPCTRASLAEFADVAARRPAAAQLWVVFFKPQGATSDWEESDQCRTAAAIPGAHLWFDVDGVEARRFGAATSGMAMLYTADGRLAFQGGLTPARGHTGTNAGQQAIETLLAGARPATVHTPVFGCQLWESKPAQ